MFLLYLPVAYTRRRGLGKHKSSRRCHLAATVIGPGQKKSPAVEREAGKANACETLPPQNRVMRTRCHEKHQGNREKEIRTRCQEDLTS
jgi:hypothetical protein